jgi:hypothetical protein
MRNAKGKRPLGGPRCRWRVILRLLLDRMGLYGLDLAQDRGHWRALYAMFKQQRDWLFLQQYYSSMEIIRIA